MVNFGIETELIIVDEWGKPVNTIPELGWDANKAVLFIAAQTNAELAQAIKSWKIWVELDASQIEIRTSGWAPLEQAVREISHLYFLLNIVIQNLWYQILMGGVPQSDFLPKASNNERYKKIHRLLLEHWGLDAQRATNIAGIHFHLELGRELGEKQLQKVMLMSRWVRKAIEEGDLNRIWMSEERYRLMQLVVDTLVKAGMLDGENPVAATIKPFAFSSPQQVLDYFGINNGGINPNYGLVGIKKKEGWVYTLEVRTPDTIWPPSAFPSYLKKIGRQLLEVLSAKDEVA